MSRSTITAGALVALATTACDVDDFFSVDPQGCVVFVDGLQHPALDYRHDTWFVLGTPVGTSTEEDADCITPTTNQEVQS